MAQDKYALIYNKVKESMEREQLFLRPDLSLKMLSRVIGTNTVYLSKAINRGYGCSFSIIVNKYRVEYIISEVLKTGGNLEELAIKLGFWSRSTFYEVFRTHTGLTPKKYMEKYGAEASQA